MDIIIVVVNLVKKILIFHLLVEILQILGQNHMEMKLVLMLILENMYGIQILIVLDILFQRSYL